MKDTNKVIMLTDFDLLMNDKEYNPVCHDGYIHIKLNTWDTSYRRNVVKGLEDKLSFLFTLLYNKMYEEVKAKYLEEGLQYKYGRSILLHATMIKVENHYIYEGIETALQQRFGAKGIKILFNTNKFPGCDTTTKALGYVDPSLIDLDTFLKKLSAAIMSYIDFCLHDAFSLRLTERNLLEKDVYKKFKNKAFRKLMKESNLTNDDFEESELWE